MICNIVEKWVVIIWCNSSKLIASRSNLENRHRPGNCKNGFLLQYSVRRVPNINFKILRSTISSIRNRYFQTLAIAEVSYEFSFLRLSVRPSVQNENLKNGSSVFFTSGGPKKSPKWSKIRILGGFDKNLTHSCVLFLLWNMKVLNGCLQKPYFWEKSVELWPKTSRPI